VTGGESDRGRPPCQAPDCERDVEQGASEQGYCPEHGDGPGTHPLDAGDPTGDALAGPGTDPSLGDDPGGPSTDREREQAAREAAAERPTESPEALVDRLARERDDRTAAVLADLERDGDGVDPADVLDGDDGPDPDELLATDGGPDADLLDDVSGEPELPTHLLDDDAPDPDELLETDPGPADLLDDLADDEHADDLLDDLSGGEASDVLEE
jgi:hypothetical protein